MDWVLPTDAHLLQQSVHLLEELKQGLFWFFPIDGLSVATNRPFDGRLQNPCYYYWIKIFQKMTYLLKFMDHILEKLNTVHSTWFCAPNKWPIFCKKQPKIVLITRLSSPNWFPTYYNRLVIF